MKHLQWFHGSSEHFMHFELPVGPGSVAEMPLGRGLYLAEDVNQVYPRYGSFTYCLRVPGSKVLDFTSEREVTGLLLRVLKQWGRPVRDRGAVEARVRLALRKEESPRWVFEVVLGGWLGGDLDAGQVAEAWGGVVHGQVVRYRMLDDPGIIHGFTTNAGLLWLHEVMVDKETLEVTGLPARFGWV